MRRSLPRGSWPGGPISSPLLSSQAVQATAGPQWPLFGMASGETSSLFSGRCVTASMNRGDALACGTAVDELPTEFEAGHQQKFFAARHGPRVGLRASADGRQPVVDRRGLVLFTVTVIPQDPEDLLFHEPNLASWSIPSKVTDSTHFWKNLRGSDHRKGVPRMSAVAYHAGHAATNLLRFVFSLHTPRDPSEQLRYEVQGCFLAPRVSRTAQANSAPRGTRCRHSTMPRGRPTATHLRVVSTATAVPRTSDGRTLN